MRFEKEKEEIKIIFCKMFTKVIDNLKLSLNYYLYEENKKDDLIIDDDIINNYERELESKCMKILLKESIYLDDFREISATLEMIDSLERIGDNAFDIKNMSDDLKSTNYKLPNKEIEALSLFILKTIEETYYAYIKEDIDSANEIIKKDDEVDKMYWNEVLHLASLNEERKIDGKATVFTSHILKYLERIEDQITNISEWIIYIKTGYHKDRIII